MTKQKSKTSAIKKVASADIFTKVSFLFAGVIMAFIGIMGAVYLNVI